mmetsp:Transcript_52513/g.114918  ORF Transcript_52513/g.114918 Transcript_52513/m.114918 type:complete len:218 (+) Transcript_52513:889-1542(+)
MTWALPLFAHASWCVSLAFLKCGHLSVLCGPSHLSQVRALLAGRSSGVSASTPPPRPRAADDGVLVEEEACERDPPREKRLEEDDELPWALRDADPELEALSAVSLRGGSSRRGNRAAEGADRAELSLRASSLSPRACSSDRAWGRHGFPPRDPSCEAELSALGSEDGLAPGSRGLPTASSGSFAGGEYRSSCFRQMTGPPPYLACQKYQTVSLTPR